jgi:hypothetical protein
VTFAFRKTADINIRDVADDTSIYQPSGHLEAAGTGLGWIGEDSEAYVRSHVRQLEVLRRAGRVECIMRNRGSRDRDLRFGHMKQVESPLAVRLNRVFCRNPVSEKVAGGQTAYDSKPERRWRHSVGGYDAQFSRNFSERPVRAMVPASIKMPPLDYSAV